MIEIPVLSTQRLVLRAPRWDDFEAYAAFRASPRSVHVGGPFKCDTAFQQFCALFGHWALRGYGRWMVADRETGAPLGVVGLYYPEGWPEPEIAWTVFDHAEGRGIAAEAALAAREHAYGVLGWETVASLVPPENERSTSLARRLGCVAEGTFDHATYGPLTIWRHPGPERV